jgi:hypothetical protein
MNPHRPPMLRSAPSPASIETRRRDGKVVG